MDGCNAVAFEGEVAGLILGFGLMLGLRQRRRG
jgi:hypothetical protein